MLIPYTATLTSERLGNLFVTHVECEVEAVLAWENGGARTQVDDVFVEGKRLSLGETWCQSIAAEIRADAEQSDYVMDKLIEADGVYLKGGIGNPSARLVRAEG